MLYFSKLKLVTIYVIIVLLSLFSFANFFDNEDNFLLSKKVNLGLDLQGGSYLLLEVDSQPVIGQKLQNKLIDLRKTLKDEKIKYQKLKLQNGPLHGIMQNSIIGTNKLVDYILVKSNNSIFHSIKRKIVDFSKDQ